MTQPRPLISFHVSIKDDGQIHYDIEFYENSFSDVAHGFNLIRKEIDRSFTIAKECPFFPSNREQAKAPITRLQIQEWYEKQERDRNP